MDYDLSRPWVRQPCDTDLSWALFSEYLFLPLPRRIVDLPRRSVGLSWSQVRAMAEADGWESRAKAWDAHLDALRAQTVERVVKEDARSRAERQGALARKLQRVGERELDRLLSVLERADGMPGVIRPTDAIRAVALGIRSERLALGDTTDQVQVQGPNVEALSVEELRNLRALQQKAERV